MEAKTYAITNGPNVFNLAISLFRGSVDLDRNDYDAVYFHLKDEERGFSCRITSAKSPEFDNSGFWILKGTARVTNLSWQSFIAKYSPVERKGTFRLLPAKG